MKKLCFGLMGLVVLMPNLLFAQTQKSTKKAPEVIAPAPVSAFEYAAFVGRMPCENKVVVTVTADKRKADFYDVRVGKALYKTKRVVTASGAVRLEDAAHGIVWLQMSNKSMLLNEKQGQRLATNCQNPEQQIVQKNMDAQPTASNP
jgi:hypothetical protein